jgi:hypothetical protein
MTKRKGMGRVHDGFYSALFYEDEERGPLFDDLIAALRAADEGRQKAIYLTGMHCCNPNNLLWLTFRSIFQAFHHPMAKVSITKPHAEGM